MQAKLRTYFVAGLGALLPVWIAYLFLRALFFIISGISSPFLEVFFAHVLPAAKIEIVVRLASLIVTLSIVLGAGFIVSQYFGKTLVGKMDDLFKHIPGIGEIYMAVKKLTNMLTTEESFDKKFRSVVLAEWPSAGNYALGLVTSEIFQQAQKNIGKELIVVFIPTPPNPINGNLVMLPRERLTHLNMRVDEALRILFSLGLAA